MHINANHSIGIQNLTEWKKIISSICVHHMMTISPSPSTTHNKRANQHKPRIHIFRISCIIPTYASPPPPPHPVGDYNQAIVGQVGLGIYIYLISAIYDESTTSFFLCHYTFLRGLCSLAISNLDKCKFAHKPKSGSLA